MSEEKAYYRCEKNGLWFLGRVWKKNELYFGLEPRDGKGNSLCDEKFPAFSPKGETDPTAPPPQAVDMRPDYSKDDQSGQEDPRTKRQILEDIKTNYGDEINPRLKKADILERERLLRMTARRDAGTPQVADTDFDPLK